MNDRAPTPAYGSVPTSPSSFLAAAEAAAASGQRAYLLAVRLRLGALVIAAVAGAFSLRDAGVADVFPWLALGGFAAALLVEFHVLTTSPDRLWYEGRAAAESIKTLEWRYAVAGAPFPETMAEDDARASVRRRLTDVSHDLVHQHVPAPPADSDLVPAALADLRRAAFAERRARYLRDRVDDQRSWYAAKASINARRSLQFLLATLVLELVGIGAAVFRVAGLIEVDLLGIVAALVAGVAAWTQTRQHGALSSAYSIAARELAVVAEEVTDATEDVWADVVARGEESISREHTLWRSTRAGALPRL